MFKAILRSGDVALRVIELAAASKAKATVEEEDAATGLAAIRRLFMEDDVWETFENDFHAFLDRLTAAYNSGKIKNGEFVK